MTNSDFVRALAIRDFHNKRVNRFRYHRPLKGETSTDFLRSLRVVDALTNFLGDGLFPQFDNMMSGLIRSMGYDRSEYV